MKSNWQTKKLGEIFKTSSGGTPLKSHGEYYAQGRIPWLRSGEVYQKEIFKSELCITEKGLKNSSAKIFPKNTVLVAMYGATAGQVGILRFEAAVNQAICGILPTKDILPEFLYYFFLIEKTKLLKLATGNAQPNISQEKIKDLQIPLPSLPEQRRIVKILDEVFEKVAKAKENAEKNLRSSKELFEVYLENAFSNKKVDWKGFSLGDVCDIKSKLIDPRKSEFLDLIHVGAGNIEIKTGNLFDLKTAKEEKLISGKFLFDDSVVLYSKIRPYLMKVAKPDFQGLCSADMYPLSPKEKIITRDYLYYLLLTSTFTKFAIKGSARAGMPKVNREHLFSYNFVLPSISEQKAIVAKLDVLSTETKKLEGIYKQKLADLEELKKSVLKKAFEGEL